MNLQYKEPEWTQLVPEQIISDQEIPVSMVLDGIWDMMEDINNEENVNEDNNNEDNDKNVDNDNIEENSVKSCAIKEVTIPFDLSVIQKTMKARYVFTRMVNLPPKATGMDYILRFEGINGYAKIYIEDQFVCEHWNFFLTFNSNITSLVGERTSFVLKVELYPQADKVCAFSQGGILHSVKLLFVPHCHITSLHVNTTFADECLTDAYMNIMISAAGIKEANNKSNKESNKESAFSSSSDDDSLKLTAVFTLWSDTGEIVELPAKSVTFTKDGTVETLQLLVKAPKKWDAEHPNLYTLYATLYVDGVMTECVKRSFGFRELKRVMNQVYINGSEVKLRGVCRHEISQYGGRCITKNDMETDVKLFKEANCNYIRTSHYPCSEYFLDLCDREGLYVELEMGLAFIARSLDFTQRDPAQTERYLSNFAETAARDYSHPSIIIWSLCNESFGGYNFDLLNRYVHKTDPSRFTKFSYPMTIREEHEAIDIWSVHYSNLEEDLAKKCDNVSVGSAPGYDLPVLHDEYVHIPCYDRTEHRRDPNVRNFWGESIRLFWDKIWNTKGALGGAIWAGIDEVNYNSGGDTVLEWGIIDVFRRRKPEHYLTRKAYSPIVIAQEYVTLEAGGIKIGIENRFSHTNLSEVRVDWKISDYSGTIYGNDIEPFGKGEITLWINQNGCYEGMILQLYFYDARDRLVDEYELPIGKPQVITWEFIGKTPPRISESAYKLTVSSDRMKVVFSKETGLIVEGSYNRRPILTGGPFLNLPYLTLGNWKLYSISAAVQDNLVIVTIDGTYINTMDVKFLLKIDEEGMIQTQYKIKKLYVKLPKQLKLRVGIDCGGLDELGVAYTMYANTDYLVWNRKGEWSCYPQDHIGRNKGECVRNPGKDLGFYDIPVVSWAEETKSYALYGRYAVNTLGSNDFRSTKSNILTVSASGEEMGTLTALSDGAHSVRMEVSLNPESIVEAQDVRITYTGEWFDQNEKSGSYSKLEKWSKDIDASATLTFKGNGIVWYGPVDTIYGYGSVTIDGVKQDGFVNQRVNGCEFPCSTSGTDKKFQLPIYSITGLDNGFHTISISPAGTKAADAKDSYIVIDYFHILDDSNQDEVKMIINNEFNYPHISWGNYCKPAILIGDGYENSVLMCLRQ